MLQKQLLVAAVSGLVVSSAHADIYTNENGLGLVPVISFEDTPLGVVNGDEWQTETGITFDALLLYVENFFTNPGADGPKLAGDMGTLSLNVTFDDPQTQFAMAWGTNPGTSTITAFLDDAVVETATLETTFLDPATAFIVVENITFDRIEIDIDASIFDFTLDNVQLGTAAPAEEVLVEGGQTNVLLDVSTLSAAGLFVSGFSSEVITPGDLGAGSVAFPINPRSGDQPTTFSYTPGTLAPFAGTIEHTGSIFFDNQFAVGNLSIGFDPDRVTDVNSGFFVESTQEGFLYIAAVLFDIKNPTLVDAQAESLMIEADLLVSPELASFLGNADLTGVDVGDALVAATTEPNVTEPEPCPADINGNGFVGLADLLAVIGAWGDEGGPADIDSNGVVGLGDLIAVLSGWGPCP